MERYPAGVAVYAGTDTVSDTGRWLRGAHSSDWSVLFATSNVNARERASRYVAALPPAIQGQNGNRHTLRVYCRRRAWFSLNDGDGSAALAE